ncbi:hypothetical protein ROA7450_01047 [Roseovarius albus]|uniref:Uncharacterized protein n=1 Tax=Roseovarius albus TaxID=1247867 RepID=A0A1X6YM87_9RHOB|nr:hypothetical protein [Roseovarius albus]SLN25366.1 hypothetical protein ROA7450_01047 [Roseovarius albus]
MSEMLNNATNGIGSIFIARESFIGELKALTRKHPDIGFGIALQTHAGEQYLLANTNMPTPKDKSQGFPTGRRIAFLENGERFKAVEVLADTGESKPTDPRAEAALLENVMKLIAQIEEPTTLPVGRFDLRCEEKCVATGTRG